MVILNVNVFIMLECAAGLFKRVLQLTPSDSWVRVQLTDILQ